MLPINDKTEITPRRREKKKRKRVSSGDEPTKPLEEVWLRFRVALPPSDMGNIFHSIRSNVYQLLMRYDANLDGVLLSISDLAFSGEKDERAYGSIVDDSHHIHFSLTARGIVFCPRVGLEATGIVTKVSSSHIGMLVFGIFNSSVYNGELEEAGFRFDETLKSWVKTTESHQNAVKLGSNLRFRIRRLHHIQGLISVEGDSPQIVLNNVVANATEDGEYCAAPKLRRKDKLRLL